MKKRFLLTGLLLLLVVFTLGACSSNNDKKTADSDSSSEQKEEASSDKKSEAKTVKVTDGSGETVEVPVNPKKVVVFDNGSLDTIQVLGAEETVVGVPVKNLPTYLNAFADTESAGGIKEPDLEKINQLQPDLIIISGRQFDFQKDLSAIAPTLYLSVDPEKTWESTKQNIETIGKIFAKEDETAEQLKKLEKDIKAFQKQAEESKYKALVVLVNEGQLSAYGKESRFGIVHDPFGFAQADENIEASTHGQSVSYEYVLEKNPDVLFVVDRTQAIGGESESGRVAENELVKQTEAGKANRVITLSPDVWYLSGGGLESTKLMLEDVKQALK